MLTTKELEERLRADVEAAGGAKKWLKRHKMHGQDHILHMITDGRAATLPTFLAVLGYRRVDRFEPISAHQ